MKGKCYICGKTFSKAGMMRHLKTHMKNDGNVKLYHIMIEGLQLPQYWLHIEIPADAKLEDLDQFLRDIWLECCGHLSAFEIDGVSYYCEYFELEPDEEDMNLPLNSVLRPGMEFYHIYDFGSPTRLKLRVVGERMGRRGKEKVRILARNDPPEIKCSCGKKAKWVCPICLVENMGENCYFCDECAKEHEHDEDVLLPIVNSPRCGVCAYKGGKYD